MKPNKGAHCPLFDLKIRVKEIQGNCPVFKVDDTFIIRNGYILDTDIPLCMHALAVILPFYSSLARCIPPNALGLGDEWAYIQCPDPCSYTGGGTVVFEIYPFKPL